MDDKKWYKRLLKALPAFTVMLLFLNAATTCVKQAIPDKIHVVVNEQEKTGIYTLQTNFLGIPCRKQIEVSVTDTTKVIPCGFPVGIYLETDGILVIDSAKLVDTQGMTVEPCYGILHSGDYITKINGEEATQKEDLIEAVNRGEGEALILTVRKNGEESEVSVTPLLTSDGTYKLGLWVRDDAQGIGTLTYLTADGRFGALGHGVSDVDTGELLEVSKGKLYEAKILSVIKGTAGTPGGLSGVINYNEDAKLGDIIKNSARGIYGTAPGLVTAYYEDAYMAVGLKQEVELGKAYVRCEVSGVVDDYEVQITKLEDSAYSGNKGMEIKVIDPRLLEKTNGIVQGMSGSPIIQNGKLIGAITHVFVQDSTKGYGILIEDMLTNQ